ncbi:MAG: phytanoyl-CoA dioxygenase family protein [Planctomycetaceae bacterium]
MSCGRRLDVSADAFGWLHETRIDRGTDAADRLSADGYVFLRDCLDPDLVEAARRRLLEQLDSLGMLREGAAAADGIARVPWPRRSFHDLATDNEPLQRLLYAGSMIATFERLLGGAVRHFDFTWMRVMPCGPGTAPHADSVYMNRGTSRLYTAWTPLMEIPLQIGGLIIMPGSHRLERLRPYFDADVDTVCTNLPPRMPQDVHGWVGPVGDGKLANDPATLRRKLGLPWLTAQTYRPGDVLVFGIHTLHASLDNTTARLRLSTDTRYQPAAEPADPRWIGRKPPGHGPQSRRDLIC